MYSFNDLHPIKANVSFDKGQIFLSLQNSYPAAAESILWTEQLANGSQIQIATPNLRPKNKTKS